MSERHVDDKLKHIGHSLEQFLGASADHRDDKLKRIGNLVDAFLVA
ncbi:MAG TPA: hypothetical protein VL866_01035 [Pyrinomonadaceae bacterium]|nr:hypothetical protein [Pyrinomonadaceae bacterium]